MPITFLDRVHLVTGKAFGTSSLSTMASVDMGTIAPYFLNMAPAISIAALLYSDNIDLQNFCQRNAAIQTIIFIVTAQIPSYLTGIMSWVDLAWPTGLTAIGLQTLFLANSDTNPRLILGALMYLFQGGRMMLGATNMVLRGHMKREMPRYQYQALRWKNKDIVKGSIWFTLMMQKEIFMQALANMGALSIPGALLACNKLGDKPMEKMEYAGVILWFLAYYIEHSSDLQKASFLARMKKKGVKSACMTEKFWSLSRHPNYLGEWIVWISLSIFAIPSLRSLMSSKPVTVDGSSSSSSSESNMSVQQLMLPLSLAACSMSIYYCLTWWTGAVPAEYYSVRKRKGYSEYMTKVPMLIPNVGDVLTYFFGAGK